MGDTGAVGGFGSGTVALFVAVALAVGLSVAGAVVFSVDDDGPSTAAAQTAADGGFSGVINLSDAETKFHGNDTDDNTGYTVTGAGDVNGDGAHDVLVSAPYVDDHGEDTGAVYLFYGPVDAGDVNVTEADVTFHGAEGDLAGWAVAAGDLDGDGTSDVVVGAPYNDSEENDSGAVYVVDGSDDLAGTVNLSTDADAAYHGENASDNAGYSVATVPHDGGDALLVGAPYANSSDVDAGAAYLVRNATDDERSVEEAADVTYEGATVRDQAGWSVADAGDFTGDGSNEVIVAAPFNHTGDQNYTGAAYVLSTDYADGETVSVAEGRSLHGVGEDDRAGWAVSTAGDANDDGHDDVVVGAPYNDSGGNDSGAAYVVHGSGELPGSQSLGDADVVLIGEGAGDQAGWSVADAGSGDVVCNGYDDVLVGAPYNNSTAVDAGAAYLVTGDDKTEERSLSDADAKFQGEGEGDRAGWAVAAANDSTGDNASDILIGATHNDSNSVNAGAAYLLAGECPVKATEEDITTPTDEPTATPEPRETEPPTPEPTDTPVETEKETPTGTPAETATPAPAQTPEDTPTETPESTPDRDLDCEDFDTWEEANEVFQDEPGDPHGLDGDNDGIPCEGLPGAPSDSPPLTDEPTATPTDEPTATPTATDAPEQTETPTETETPTPEPTLEVVEVITACGPDDVSFIGVTNPNQDVVEVVVTDEQGQEPINTALLPAESRGIEDLPDGNYTVTTIVDGETIGTESVRIDCESADGDEPTETATQTPAHTTETTPDETPESTATPTTTTPDGDLDCDDFATWEEASEVFQAESGDPHGLDGDDDGVPCEEFPGAPSDSPTSTATPEPTPTGTPTATPTPESATSTPSSEGGNGIDLPAEPSEGDYDCDDFETQEQAQDVYEQDTSDPHGLDSDDDGEACEGLS